MVNGQKLYTSLAGYADWIWLAARTDPDAPKHKGISIFTVPTTAPGFSWAPLHTIVDAGTTTTFYEDVRVADRFLVGGLNRGWKLITNQLNYERVSICPPGMAECLIADTHAWARATRLPDGRRVIDQDWVQASLARIYARLDVLKLFNWKVAASAAMDPAEASATKVFGTEFFCETYRALIEIVGQAGALRRGSPGAALQGRIERAYQGTLFLTFGGGTNEVQRDLIALFGLGMPRVPRF